MSNYRDSEMHKSIMREKAKQDMGRKKVKTKESAPSAPAAKSGFIDKIGQAQKSAANRQEWRNPVSKTIKELRK